jgi:hypothetical protein
MAGKNKANFELFKRTFLTYQKEWGLNNWDVTFKSEQMADCYGDINTLYEDKVATVRLSPDCSTWQCIATAKHEAIHLLLADLHHMTTERYVSVAEVTSILEGTIRRLAKLLPDVKPLEASALTDAQIFDLALERHIIVLNTERKVEVTNGK